MFKEIFIVVIFISIIIEARNAGPYCYLFSGNSTLYPKPHYQCLNQKSFPVHLTNPEVIKTLYLWDNKGSNNLQVLKKDDLFASKTTNLETLILSKCKIKEIEKGAFRGTNKLTQLSIAHNEIKELDLNVFEDLPSLKTLWLHDNPLTTFLYNSTFPHGNLTVLHLASCRLRSLNARIFENLVNLGDLSIYGNQFETLDWKILLPLKKLQYIALHENPFHCDCQIKFLLDYLQKRIINWNYWKKKPSCSSSSFDEYIDSSLAARFSQQLIGVDWNIINRQHLVCLPEVSSLQRNKSPDNNNISLECQFSGYPKPKVIWRIDGEILQIDNRNKHLIETKAAEKIDEPGYNYKFVQTLFISFLPFSAQSLTSQVTCQASRSVFKSTESNAVTVSVPNMEINTVASARNSKRLEPSSPVPNGTEGVPINPESPVTIEMERVPADVENSIQTTVFLIIGAVSGLAVILIIAILVAIRCRKTIPFYQFLPQKDPAPPVKYDATDHDYEYIRASWVNRQDEDGYETPISLSIQNLPLPPLPQPHNPKNEANHTR